MAVSLKQYRQKRRFKETPEPTGADGASRGGPLRFVVQEHAARSHHYDLRIEVGGTLKSWAVPKGPSQDIGEKRLAIMTEDHPLEYLKFHGEIPAGNYGAGTMNIWDDGTYQAADARDRADSEAAVLKGLNAGKVKVILQGRKLKGAYTLTRFRDEPKNWLLMKSRDKAVTAQSQRGPASVLVQVGPHVVKLTNLGKVYWPEEGYTKGDLIAYYQSVAAELLPHLRDRPLSLHRHPDGIDGASFYQKNIERQPPPDWVATTVLHSDRENKDIRYLLCQNEATLLYIANLGSIEVHPWLSRVKTLDQPDYLAIDLDPEEIDFRHVIEAASAVHKLLDRIDAPSYVKTSGKSGLHLYVPLGARYNYDQAKQFAELIATLVHLQLPDTTSVLRRPVQRRERVYLDYLQNRRGQTLASAYSVRPIKGALVSTPLKWTEVRKGLDPTRHTIRTTRKRLDKLGDLWEPLFTDKIDLLACLERLQSRMGRSAAK